MSLASPLNIILRDEKFTCNNADPRQAAGRPRGKQGMGGTQSTDVGQPSKLSAPLPSLRWELQSRPKGLVKIDDFRLIEEVHAQPELLCTCSEQRMAQVTPRLTLHSITPHTPHTTPRAAYTAGDRLLAARGR